MYRTDSILANSTLASSITFNSGTVNSTLNGVVGHDADCEVVCDGVVGIGVLQACEFRN